MSIQTLDPEIEYQDLITSLFDPQPLTVKERVEQKLIQVIAPQEDSKEESIPRSDDPIEWIQSHFYIPERKDESPPAIVLAPYQVAALREARRKDNNGKFIYNIVVWGDIKKSAKSSIAAAIALYCAYHIEWGSIKIIANDLKQADSRVAYFFRRALELNPRFEKGKNYRQSGYKIILTENHAEIEALPIDPGGEAGGNDDLIIFSELWAARHKAMGQMWTEMTLSPLKFGYSQRWIETYAGYSGESPVLEPLYERGVKQGQKLDLSYTDSKTGEYHGLSDLEIYANGGLLCLWNTIPRLDWQTREYYAEEEDALLPSEFLRVHRNQWASGIEKFVETIWWDQCHAPLPPLTKNESVIIALDAAKGSETTRPADCFAVVAVTRCPGRPQDVAVRYCGIWQAPKGQLLDYAPIEQEIRRLCKEFSVVEVTYDPAQLHDMTGRLRNEGLGNFKEFNQNMPRLKADKRLRDMIISRRIAHDGNPLLREHIDNANIKNHGEDGIRIIKRTADKKVDSAVALSMATERCMYYNLT